MTTTMPVLRTPVSARIHSYLSTKDLSPTATLELLELARTLKRMHRHREHPPLLAGQTLAMVFQKPSLRTRVSFEAGMTQLGGHAIYLGPEDIKLGSRETVEDIAIVLSRMSDLIMARVFGHEIVVELAKYATVPVINGLSDLEHPCQILGDLLTILERKERLAGLRVVFVGDGNNVSNSLLYGAALMGMHCTVTGPAGYEPPAAVLADARAMVGSGITLEHTTDVRAACRNADVIYTDVWTSMGQEAESKKRLEAFQGYQVNQALLSLAKPDAIVLHCLPAHYGEEIDYPVSRSANSAIFDQAENRLHAQKALMVAMAR
jgi:ornithine carbamoyltransferase